MNSFRADASTTTGQTNLPDCAYIKLNMPNEVCDTGNHYDPTLSRWTPPAGPIIIQGQVWVGDVSQGSVARSDYNPAHTWWGGISA